MDTKIMNAIETAGNNIQNIINNTVVPKINLEAYEGITQSKEYKKSLEQIEAAGNNIQNIISNTVVPKINLEAYEGITKSKEYKKSLERIEAASQNINKIVKQGKATLEMAKNTVAAVN